MYEAGASPVRSERELSSGRGPFSRVPRLFAGTDAGQFNCPHNLTILDSEKPGGLRRLAVCDRENMRVQIFTLRGELIGSWHMHRPVAICTGVFRSSINSEVDPQMSVSYEPCPEQGRARMLAASTSQSLDQTSHFSEVLAPRT